MVEDLADLFGVFDDVVQFHDIGSHFLNLILFETHVFLEIDLSDAPDAVLAGTGGVGGVAATVSAPAV